MVLLNGGSSFLVAGSWFGLHLLPILLLYNLDLNLWSIEISILIYQLPIGVIRMIRLVCKMSFNLVFVQTLFGIDFLYLSVELGLVLLRLYTIFMLQNCRL